MLTPSDQVYTYSGTGIFAQGDKHLTHNTQSRHGSYKMQLTMTIPNWDLILNPSTRAFYTDYVGELKKVFQQKIVFVRF